MEVKQTWIVRYGIYDFPLYLTINGKYFLPAVNPEQGLFEIKKELAFELIDKAIHI